ncbi:Rieske 2Fe-2S domain-containing protein [Deinococcus pimensis]|uniref:Rieske 2Fe-2S domain-containing protein n=1 Tax=Deinococcus pimensis TaxID=309888 RepID=UPI0004B505A4|nr:Rieske 2Fe-2S domain-containing protein [Deinococcus pimensis]
MSEDPAPRTVSGVTRRRLLEFWWTVPVAATLGAFGFIGEYAWRVTFGKRRAGDPAYRPGPRERVASVAELREDYATREFSYAGTPCVLMRLPATSEQGLAVGGARFAAWSRVCTHLGCLVLPLRDREATALTYNYRPDHPVLGCPCHFSVFDPLRGGESVFGKALYPLPRVRLEARGGTLFATGIEPPPGTRPSP